MRVNVNLFAWLFVAVGGALVDAFFELVLCLAKRPSELRDFRAPEQDEYECERDEHFPSEDLTNDWHLELLVAGHASLRWRS